MFIWFTWNIILNSAAIGFKIQLLILGYSIWATSSIRKFKWTELYPRPRRDCLFFQLVNCSCEQHFDFEKINYKSFWYRFIFCHCSTKTKGVLIPMSLGEEILLVNILFGFMKIQRLCDMCVVIIFVTKFLKILNCKVFYSSHICWYHFTHWSGEAMIYRNTAQRFHPPGIELWPNA